MRQKTIHTFYFVSQKWEMFEECVFIRFAKIFHRTIAFPSLFLLDNCWVNEAFKIGKNRCVDSVWEGKNNSTWRETLREMTVSQWCLRSSFRKSWAFSELWDWIRSQQSLGKLWQSSTNHNAVLGRNSLTWHFKRGFTF